MSDTRTTEELWNVVGFAAGLTDYNHREPALEALGILRSRMEALEAQVSELQSATKNEATRIIAEHIPWQSNDTHPRRVVLAYIEALEAEHEAAKPVAGEFRAWGEDLLDDFERVFLAAHDHAVERVCCDD